MLRFAAVATTSWSVVMRRGRSGCGGPLCRACAEDVQRCVLQQHDRLAIANLTRGDFRLCRLDRQLEHLDVLLLHAASGGSPLCGGVFGDEEMENFGHGAGDFLASFSL